MVSHLTVLQTLRAVFIVAGLCGPVIFAMYVTGAEMMMEVMVGNLNFVKNFKCMFLGFGKECPYSIGYGHKTKKY